MDIETEFKHGLELIKDLTILHKKYKDKGFAFDNFCFITINMLAIQASNFKNDEKENRNFIEYVASAAIEAAFSQK